MSTDRTPPQKTPSLPDQATFDPAQVSAEVLASAPPDIQRLHAWLTDNQQDILKDRRRSLFISIVWASLIGLVVGAMATTLNLFSLLGVPLLFLLTWGAIYVDQGLATRVNPGQLAWAETTLQSWYNLHLGHKELLSKGPEKVTGSAGMLVERIVSLTAELPHVAQAAQKAGREVERIEAELSRLDAIQNAEPVFLESLETSRIALQHQRQERIVQLAELYSTAAVSAADGQTSDALADAALRLQAHEEVETASKAKITHKKQLT